MRLFAKEQRAAPSLEEAGADDAEGEERPAAWEDDYDPAEEKAERRRALLRGFLLVTISLLVGLAAGLFIAQQRYRGKMIIASINGETIVSGDFYPRLEAINGQELMQQMANEVLQLQYAKKLGVAPTEAEVEARFRQVSSKPHFNEFLLKSHQIDTDIKRNLRNEMAVNNVMGKGLTITEADKRAYYNKMADPKNPAARFYTPPGITLGLIANVSREQCAAAAQELQRGADWAAVAQKYSQDNSKTNGGVLQPILRGRTQFRDIPGFESMVFNLNVGEQIGPKQVGKVWMLLRCVAKTPEETQPFESVQFECKQGAVVAKLSKEQAAKIRDDYIQFQRNSVIHTFWPNYKNVLGGR